MRNQTDTENIKLSDEDLEIIRNIQCGHYADRDINPYEVGDCISKQANLNFGLYMSCFTVLGAEISHHS